MDPNVKNPTLEDLVKYWNLIIEDGVHNGVDGGYMTGGLKNMTTFWKKKMIFTEIGYCSGNCTTGPQLNIPFQTLHYTAMFEAWRLIDWFEGVFW